MPVCFCWATLLAAVSAEAQGTFQNLNFESANLTPIPSGQYGGEVPISSAMPGWDASIGGVAVTQVLQNSSTLGGAHIDIFGPNWSSDNPGIIDGNYTVFLQAFNVGQGNVSLWQTGTIPANTESIEFSAWNNPTPGSSALVVTFSGNSLSPVPIGSGVSPSGQSYTVYGANIAPYAGESGQLEFTSVASDAGANWNELDDITFSSQAIPEPSPLALTGVGALLFALYRRFAPKRP
jgi:hypothetical protein